MMDLPESTSITGTVEPCPEYGYPLVFHSSGPPEVTLRDPADALPSEIMGHIFSWLSRMRPPSKHSLGWIVVSHVALRWRNIALNTPRSWNHIAYELPYAMQTEMIARAREVPVHWTVPARISPHHASHVPGLPELWADLAALWQQTQTQPQMQDPVPAADFNMQGFLEALDEEPLPPLPPLPPLEDVEATDDETNELNESDETDSESDADDFDIPIQVQIDVQHPPMPALMLNPLQLQIQQAAQEMQAIVEGQPLLDELNATAVKPRQSTRADDLILDLARRSLLSGLSCSAGFLVALLQKPGVLESFRTSITDLDITAVTRIHDLLALTQASSATATLLSACLRHLVITYSAPFSDVEFTSTPPDLWARLPGLTHLSLTFHGVFPGPECIASLENLPSLVKLELCAPTSYAAPRDLPSQPQFGSLHRVHLPVLEELWIEDRARGQRMSFTLLSRLSFPSYTRTRLFMSDEAESFVGTMYLYPITIPRMDVKILEITFDPQTFRVEGWPGPHAYELGERGAELSIVVDSGWGSHISKPLIRQKSDWFSELLHNMSLLDVSVVRLERSGVKGAAVTGWDWLARFHSLQELCVDVEVDKHLKGGEALRGLLAQLDVCEGAHRELRTLQLQGHMLCNGADEDLLGWLKRRKAAGIPISQVIVDDASRAKLQALRRDWIDQMERYVDHLECDFGWNR